MAQHKVLPLLHQRLPMRVRVFLSKREPSDFLEYLMPQLVRQVIEPVRRTILATRRDHLICPPVSSLRRDVCGADDVGMGINEEQRNNLAVSRLCGICELEGLDLVQHHIGKGYEPSLPCVDDAELLDRRTFVFQAKHIDDPVSCVLPVTNIRKTGSPALVRKGKARVGDVLRRVVIDRASADGFVLERVFDQEAAMWTQCAGLPSSLQRATFLPRTPGSQASTRCLRV